MIPSCLQLNKYQKQQVDAFVKSLPKGAMEAALEETCCVESPLTFEVRSTGIGDCVCVKAFGRTKFLYDPKENL